MNSALARLGCATWRAAIHLALACGLWALACAGSAAPGLKLHVPSPDWRDQVIYFAMTDRFDDGDARNNDFGQGEFNRGDGTRFQGGDLRGLARRLDYIRGLGATALWLTPPVANQWLDPQRGHAGYHGYWAEHFMKVDRHLGSLSDYQLLSHGLHRRGMYLVQDIVLNHVGYYFGYHGGWDANDPTRYFERYVSTPPVAAPSQPPFHLTDARNPAHRRAAIYHWTPDISDYTDPAQTLTYRMGGLDDLNTENPVVRRALRHSFGHWIQKVGVDAFRIDTAFYVPPDFLQDFMTARDARAPGMAQVARATGRRQFHVFGEGFAIDKPGKEVEARRIEAYMRDDRGRAVLPGMLNFPLYGTLGDVFARGAPTTQLGQRIDSMVGLHPRLHWMPSFVDNHDVDRFLSGGSTAGLKQALLALFTLPGIPTIYYGTEQGFTEPRASMFAAGHGSGGRDRFDAQAPLYQTIASLAALRREHRVLSRGLPEVLAGNAAGPGAFAYLTRYSKGAKRGAAMPVRGARAGADQIAATAPLLTVFNTAEHAVLLDNLALPAGAHLQGLWAIDGSAADQRVGADGRLHLRLAPRSGAVWRVAGATALAKVQASGSGPSVTSARSPSAPSLATSAPSLSSSTPSPSPAPQVEIDALPNATAQGDFILSGRATHAAALLLVVDGDLASAQRIEPAADGRWQAQVNTAAMIDPATPHRLVVLAQGGAASADAMVVTAPLSFHVQRQWLPVADVADPAGDDHGPNGRYVYPTDATYGARRSMDLRHVKVATSGGALQIDLGMAALSRSWNPPNGFDHVAFTLFIELPGRADGATLMPQQHTSLPAGMRWHYRLRAHGWSNALFTAAGASATNEGTPVSPAAVIEVDQAQQRVRFTLSAAALGHASLAGARLYVTTWDYDGGYRALAAGPQAWAMGGGDPAHGARVMDDSVVITLP